MFVVITYAAFTLFFFILCSKTSVYEERVTIQKGDTLRRFDYNLREYVEDRNLFASHRFWFTLFGASVWLHFVDTLCLSYELGPYMIQIKKGAVKFLQFAFFWLISLIFFSLVAVMWLGNVPQYGSVIRAGNSLFMASIG